MIYSINIKDPKRTPIKWFNKAFPNPRTFEFKPGLNILWGINGSGKSTLIKLLATMFHCSQGGRTTVTQTSINHLWDFKNDIDFDLSIEHDGQSVRHFDSAHTVGFNGSYFDDDFFSEGVKNQVLKASEGQSIMFKFQSIFHEIVAGAVPEVSYMMDKNQTNDVWKKRIESIERLLEKNADRGQPTVLLDEPERSHDLRHQPALWRFLRAYSSDVQFIVASHSLFALNIPEANYIELSQNYLKQSSDALHLLSIWSSDKPKKIEKK